MERYADDVIVHCVSKMQAEYILHAIKERMQFCKLELNLEKTKIVYCKRNRRNDDHPHCSFDFLGFTFRPRITMSKEGESFIGFNPAVSRIALKKMADTVRSWHLGRRSDLSLEEIARRQNPVVRGWNNYYGAYHPSALFPLYEQLTEQLVKWAKRKYKKLRRYENARKWLRSVARKENQLFAYWRKYYRMHGGITRAV